MEDPTLQHEAPSDSGDGLSAQLESKRRTAQQELAAHRQRLADLEFELLTQMERLSADVSGTQNNASQLHEELEQRAAELRRQSEQVEATQRELQQQQAAWEAAQHETARQHEEQAAQLAKLRDQFHQDREQLDRQRADLETRLQAAGDEVQQAQDEAQRLHEKLAAVRAEAESQSSGGQVALQQARADAESLREQLAKSRELLSARGDELKQARQELDELRHRAAGDTDGADGELNELNELRQEREVMLERLTDAELELKKLRKLAAAASEQDDLRRRFEMAVEEVRELKNRNAELQSKLKGARSESSASSRSATTQSALDWEAQKQRLLAQLGDEYDEDDPQDQADRTTIESTIRITDEVVAQKQAEIEELHRLLDEQSSNIGSVAVGAAAIAELVDKDELIRQERDSLKRLQTEWREKLRKAEIDVSVERAKLARERAELEEKLRMYESIQSQSPAAPGETDTERSQKKTGARRWLERLGLGGSDNS